MRICMVNADNYPMLNPAYGDSYIGGESVQQVLLARAFRDRGHEVSTVVVDFGQPDGEVIDGIRIWKSFRRSAGLPGLRFLHPRLTGLLRALRRADADLYYQSCAGNATGITAWFCRRHNRRFAFRVAHDTDCIPGQQLIPTARDRRIYEWGLRHSDLIAAQGEKQARLLQDHYGLDSVVVNMVVEQPAAAAAGERDVDLLWVNNLRPFKRPDLVIDLARRLPQRRIVMIGGAVGGHQDLYERVNAAAGELPNLDYRGFVPYSEVNAWYGRARVFVNTSDSEGFPNSFLQAWIRGTPVVSFFDPDGLIEGEGLGCSPRGLDEMASVLDALLDDEARLQALSRTCSAYARSRYGAAGVAARYDELFAGLAPRPATGLRRARGS